ncbi:uncharacterized protein [Rutidosis leptorrhynchoides]|uniref:uncharacterized protein isoform X2 n=1 Tax=Rutidosis leptorrhynchoides TaxID=125765 RepID=UPI003A99EE40
MTSSGSAPCIATHSCATYCCNYRLDGDKKPTKEANAQLVSSFNTKQERIRPKRVYEGIRDYIRSNKKDKEHSLISEKIKFYFLCSNRVN